MTAEKRITKLLSSIAISAVIDRRYRARALSLQLFFAGAVSFMQKRKIGSLEVSVVGVGCNNFGWRIDATTTAEVVDAAIESGVNFFDTADQQGASPKYVRQAMEASLRQLGTDRIDLYQLHQPDPETPIADALGALDELVRAGKVREIGCSNFSVAQLREAEAAAKGGVGFVSVQNEFSLFHQTPEKDGVLAECQARGISFLPYFPLANGLLTGKYRAGKPLPEASRATEGFGPKVFTKGNLEIVESLIGFAEKRGHTILELAFAWLLAHQPVVSVIAGASKPEQIRANAAAADWKLNANELAAVDALVSSN